MKILFLALYALIFSGGLTAQTEQLFIKKGSKGAYVEHKVAAKENFYSIGRLFNVHPKHLALFNSLEMTKGLSIGQTIKIPLSDTNFTRKSAIGLPVYYVTGNAETVYNVSTNNNVLMERLRKWNKIPSDKLPAGTRLVIGYLMNGQSQAIAVNATPKPDSSGKTLKGAEKDITKNTPADKPSPKKDDAKKEEPKTDRGEVKKSDESAAVKEDEKKQAPGQGYFRPWFEQQVKQQAANNEQTVTSGIFKTSSGWTDAKYYLLMNGAEPGTIVKITNPTNNKIVYAKLLGEMTDPEPGQGLNIRISNAAAVALDIAETDKFILKLNY